MLLPSRTSLARIALLAAFATCATSARSQEKQYPKQADLPNPYKLVENWPNLPASMNGGHWGELIRADIDPQGLPPASAAPTRRFWNSIPQENC
jgi:hypothetical protein